MAHESFEDKEVADYLNKHFVPIKVDKEERPDVDSIYMNVCQNLTGSGGWPLTIFMLPNQKPFFAGTYFPKKSKYNMPGLLDLLEAVQDKWVNDRESLKEYSEEITDSLKEKSENRNENRVTKSLILDAAKTLMNRFDKENGGFSRAPKFPTPQNLMFLLRVAQLEVKPEFLVMVEKTLDAMYRGGIFDHIGYGFSRYSTDSIWLVPHFEKMLYDNALLLLTYLEAYQITKKDPYKQIAERIMEYVLRELTHEEGGFYCAQDADSEGVEGKYYVFKQEEIVDLLGKEDGKYFNNYYGITKKGNFEGENIPNRIHEIKLGQITTSDSSLNHNLDAEKIEALRKKVFEYRLQRTTLHKDDKILTSWNGIMIAAFAKAYEVLKEETYLQAAKKADQFLQEHLSYENRLFVHYREGKSIGHGHIDDYAFYTWGLISLYEATYNCDYLKQALKYTNILMEEFFDEEQGGFYLYAKDAEALIHRPKEIYDGAIPSGNSVAAYVLFKLASYTGDLKLSQAAEKQIRYIASAIEENPSAYCFSLMAMMQAVYPSKELVCLLPDTSLINKVQELLSKHFLPNLTVLIKTNHNQEHLEEIASFTADYKMSERQAFYLCENHACRAPVFDINEVESML